MLKYIGFNEEAEEENNDEFIAKQAEIDSILKPLYTKESVKALEYLKDKLVNRGVADVHDTQIGVGLKQGRIDMILELLSSVERVNNGR